MDIAVTNTPVNWLLLGELVVVVIVAAAFLFYVNRLFGAVVAFFIRLYTWRKHQAYITIGSLQISPLAGRIAFRAVEYHSSNISFRALHGHVTFRYWWGRVRQEGDSQSTNTKRTKLPCRLVVYAEGVEGFVYNRTPAYDGIVERMKKHEREEKSAKSSSSSGSSEANPVKVRLRKAFKSGKDELSQLDSNDSSDGPIEKPHTLPDTILPVETPHFDSVDWFRELLPVELTVVQGSVVLGSDATPMVLVGDFKRANGLIEITESRSICDKYKMIVNLNFQTVNVMYRTNVDWSGPLLAHGKKVYDELIRRDPDLVKRPPSNLSTKATFRAFSRIYHFISDPIFSKPPRAGMPRDRTWKGLARYREGEAKEPTRTEREYGKIPLLLKTDAMDFTYYADTPGPVPRPDEIALPDKNDELGNVDLPPEYGIDIAIHGGDANYGPWADRQREALQRAFAPSIFFDTEPKPRLNPGETRVHANLALSVQFIQSLRLILPTREPSKDWQFDAKPDAARSFGWMGVTIGPNSSIIYTQSQFATQRGYDAMLVIHLDSLAMNTSINGGCDFINAKACRLSVTMPTPLRWNAQRNWGIDVTLEEPDIALLRDHVTLISDLAKDWSSGVEGDFHHFVPNHYNFRVAMNKYAFHLFINDNNIVDDPRSRPQNAYVDVTGPTLLAHVAVASTQYRPDFSVIPFSVNLNDAKVQLSLPIWDTHGSFAKLPMEIGRIGSASAAGSYRFYSRPHPDHQETLTLHLDANRVAFKCLGWALRRLFCVKDNYFGMFTQFTTSQEYLEKFDHDPEGVGDPVREKYRPGRSDAFAVQVTLDVRDSLILLSDEIYSCDSGLALPVPQLQMSLRSVEAFMELSLDVPPTYVVSAPNIEAAFKSCRSQPPSSVASLFIEGITLKANRLFGPQPEGTTYLCLWEAIIPKVSAFLTPAFLATVQQSVRAVMYNFSDVENAPTDIYIPATPPDVTFFKLSLDTASIALEVGDAGVAVDLPRGVNLDTSSLATCYAASSLGVLIPAISVNVLSRPTARHKWSSVGYATSGVSVDMYSAPKDWQDKARAQQKFLRREDGPTQRIWYMYKDGEDTSNGHHINSLYLPRPRVVVDDEDSNASDSDAASDSTASRPRPVNRRSRSRSFRTAKESFRDSSDDESDDVSSIASSASSTDTKDDHDMADILADQYKRFRSFATPASHTDPGREPANLPYKLQANGKVVRINAEPILLRGDVDTASSLGSIAYALSQDTSRPLQVIDATLASLVSQWKDRNAEAIPLTLDIAVPSVDLSISTSSPSSGPVSQLDTYISGLRTVITQQSAELGVTATLTSSRITLSSLAHARPAISLADIGQDFISPDHYPVIHLDQLGLDIAFDQRGSHRQIRIHANSSDLKAVSFALPIATQTIDVWKTALAALPSSDQAAGLTPLLVHAANAAGDHNASAPQPTFASLAYHSLQVNDSRNIRTEHGWRILSRIRQILLTYPDIVDTHPSDADITMDRLAALDWFPDAGNALLVRQLPFVQKAFNLSPLVENAKQVQTKAAFMSVENVVVRHYDQLLGTSRIGSSFVRIGTSSAGVYRTRQVIEEEPEVQDRAVIAIGSIDAEVQDSIFAVYRHVTSAAAGATSSDAATTPPQPILSNHVLLLQTHLSSADLAILAGGLRLNAKLNDATSTFGHRQRLHKRHNLPAYSTVRNDANLVVVNVAVKLWQPSDDDNPSNKADREVLNLSLSGGKLLYDGQGSTKTTSVKARRVIVGIQSVQFDSRPTLRRALDFAQNWQEKHYAHYQPTITQIRAELAKSPAKVPQPNRLPANFAFDILVERAGITIRTAKSAWIGWQVGRLYACQQGSTKNHSFGIRAAPQSVGFYSSRNLSLTKDTVKLDLPDIKVDGSLKTSWKQGHYDVEVQLGHFNCIVKPSALDRLLSLYKKLAPEIRQLVKDYGSYARTLLSSDQAPKPAEQGDLFQLVVGVDGISIGLRADDVATTLLLQAFALRGSATNQANRRRALSWQAGVQHFEVSLGQLDATALSCQHGASRKYKSAYMFLDVDVYETPSDTEAPSKIGVSLSQIQTFMHIAALSEISDLVSSWISDVHILTDQRGDDVAEVKHQTSRFLKKIDTNDAQPEDSWFSTRLLKVDIASFGLAIPLGAQTAIDLREQDTETPALLLSVRSISFTNRRNETARFALQHIRLQFVAQFDNTKTEHFAGEFHSSLNRMTLPSIESEAQMSSSPDAWTLAAHCTATDFHLGLDPTVTDGIFQLIDLYERGCHHIDYLEKRYADETGKGGAETLAAKYDTPPSPIGARQRQRIYLRLSFVFESGKVQLYRAPQLSRSPLRSKDHDEMILPGISVWIDYAGPTKGIKEEADTAGLVTFNTAIHRSRNVLKPSILPFFAQVAARIERRIKSRTDRKSSASAVTAPSSNATVKPATGPIADIIRIRLTLRIDQSELRFACTNDSYAYVNLRWESGGFFACTTIGADETNTFAGTITGVTTNLSHEYDGRSCIEASARDLAFSIIHTPDWRDGQTGVSVVMDTKVSAQFRLDLFSAWLTFMAVWVDNAPSLDIPIIAAIGDNTATVPVTPATERKRVGVAILARFQAIEFDADIAVTHAKLEITPVILHTLSNGLRTRVELEVGKTEITAAGDVSGVVRSDSFRFQTSRKSTRATDDPDLQLLSLKMHAGDLRGSLFLGQLNIIRFHVEPATVKLSDDWRDPSAPPLLAFAVHAGRISAVTRLLAIPQLLSRVYTILDAVATQHRIAASRSEAFKNRQIEKQTDSSPIAAALVQTMQKTATQRGLAVDCDLQVSQSMTFKLAGIDIGVFNDNTADGQSLDFYQFLIQDVGADLLRKPGTEDGKDKPFRDLALSVGSIRWNIADGRAASAAETKDISAEDMIKRGIRSKQQQVAMLPSMDLRMDSDEYTYPSPRLLYHFVLVWGKTDSDIAIWPNFFDSAWRALKKLIDGIEHEEAARARRLGIIRPNKQSDTEKEDKAGKKKGKDKAKARPTVEELKEGLFSEGLLKFEPRDPAIETEPPIPNLKVLGSGTKDATRLIPTFYQGVRDLPRLSHRFVTTSLEEGMDMLLKLYAKQLPERRLR